MAVNNALNLNATGIVTHDGAGTFSGNTVTEGAVLLGGASNAITDTGVLAKGVILVGDGTTAPTELAVGTDTYVLSADSGESSGVIYVDPGTLGGGAYTFISTGTASTSASLTFTGLTSSYFTYLFIFDELLPATDGANLVIRTSTDGGSTYDSGASDYNWNNGTQLVSTQTGTASAADTGIDACLAIGSASNEGTSGIVHLFNPSGTNFTKVHCTFVSSTTTGTTKGTFSGGERESAADVDAIQFIMSSGNITSGTIKMYGISAS